LIPYLKQNNGNSKESSEKDWNKKMQRRKKQLQNALQLKILLLRKYLLKRRQLQRKLLQRKHPALKKYAGCKKLFGKKTSMPTKRKAVPGRQKNQPF
jgi:hypothetical protein